MALVPGDLWLISAPGEKSAQDTWDTLNRTTSGLSTNHKFSIPDLKKADKESQDASVPCPTSSEFPEKEQTTQQALSEAANISGLVSEPARLSWKIEGGLKRVVLSNTSGERRAVKVKCSDNELYRVNPVFSFIEPGQCIGVDIIRDVGKPKLDKVLFVAAKAEPSDPKAKALFQSGGNGPTLVLPLVVSTV